MFRTECYEVFEIGISWRIEHSEYERRCILGDRHLDLWQPTTQAQSADQFAQLVEQLVNRAGQHFTATHVCKEWRMALAKADKDAPFASNIFTASRARRR